MPLIGLKFFRREQRLIYLAFDPKTREAMAIDAHPESIDDFRDYLSDHSLKLKHVFDTQPWERSGASVLASQYGATESDRPTLGALAFESRPALGLAQGARVLGGAGVLFAGQAILPGEQSPELVRDEASARAFREELLRTLPPSTLVYPSFDRLELVCTTIGRERGTGAGAGVSSISVDKYAAKLRDRAPDTAYLDVRDPGEYLEGHPSGTRNLPLSELGFHLEELLGYRRIYVSCLSGRRGQVAAKTLAYLGAPEVINVSGGFQAWSQAELPVSKGESHS